MTNNNNSVEDCKLQTTTTHRDKELLRLERMKFSLVIYFLTLASANEVQARAMRSASARENENEGRGLTALDLSLGTDLSLSLSMSAELEGAQLLSLESGLSLSLSMPAELEGAQLLSSDSDSELEGAQLLMTMVDESKYSKLLSSINKNNGGSKASKKSCAFANPAIEQVFNFPLASFEVLVLHALVANYYFEDALEAWLSKSIKLENVEEGGFELGLLHDTFFAQFTPDVSLKTVCAMQGALVRQMEKTCFYSSRKKDYETIAVALMTGFAEGVGLTNFDGCEE